MKSLELFSYDPEDIELTIGGVDIYASGAVVVSSNQDRTSEQVGLASKQICISSTTDKTGTLTIPVMANDIYDVAFREWSRYAKSAFPIILKHKSLNIMMVTLAWYKTQPDLNLDAQPELRAHTLTVADSTMSVISAVENIYDLFKIGKDIVSS